ncbi:MAG: sigma-70 family RNA polymerase sigma factor [Planctomycetota bacterium]
MPNPPVSAAPIDALLGHADHVRRLALRLCADAHGVDDAIQDTWLTALERPPRHAGNLRGWLGNVLRNGLRMTQRAARRRARRETAVLAARDGEDLVDVVARAELHERLVQLVLALPEPQRALVWLVYFEGRDPAVVAALHGLTPDAVRAHLRRARASLRLLLERDPRTRSALAAIALPAIGHGLASAAGVLLVEVVMKKLLFGLAALLLVGFGVWWVAGAASSAGSPPARATAAVAVAAADPAESLATAPPTEDAPDLDRRPAPVAAPTSDLAVRLLGLDPRAPWTARLRLRLEGRDEARDEWLSHEDAFVPDGDGQGRFALPAWAHDRTTKWRVVGEDPNYLDVEVLRDGALPLATGLTIEVQAVAVLRGRVVDEAGAPVPAARIAAFLLAEGRPEAEPSRLTSTSDDGAFVLQVPPDTPLYLVAAAMEEASLSGRRLTSRHGAIATLGRFRSALSPAACTCRGAVGTVTDAGTIVLPAAVSVTAVVRWSDGGLITGARVVLRPEPAANRLSLGDDASLAFTTVAQQPAMLATATTASDGRALLGARPGGRFVLEVTEIDGFVLQDPPLAPVGAVPSTVAIDVPRPVRFVAMADGAPVADAWFELKDAAGSVRRRIRGSKGELQVVPATAADAEVLQVVARADAFVSSARTLQPSLQGQRVELAMSPRLARVDVEFEAGPQKVRNARFVFDPVGGGPSIVETGQRDDRGQPFTMWLEPGRYRVRIGPAQGERTGTFLLPSAHDLDLPPGGLRLSVPAAFGGRFHLAVCDRDGRPLAGSYAVRSVGGTAGAMRAPGDPAGSAVLLGELPPSGVDFPATNLAPGQYELEVDLGPHGVIRRPLTIVALAMAQVLIRLP